MEANVKQTRACEDIERTSEGTGTGANQSDKETTYWGVLCKTCRELVAFDACPYVSFGSDAASMKPGAIRCGKGHNHIYFPRDFRFCRSAVPIAEAVMQENRETYRAVNSPGQRTSHDYVAEGAKPKAHPASDVPAHGIEICKPPSPRSVPDPRRAAAQMAAKERWAKWAGEKAK